MGSPKTGKQPEHLADDWHALDVDVVREKLTSDQSGLTPEEVTKRQHTYGPNRFSEVPPPSLLMRVLRECKSPLMVVLILAAVVTLMLGEFIDSAVITIALLIAVLLGVFQEGRASQAFNELRRSQVHKAVVIRGGKRHEISAEELVLGDVVELQDGALVPADIRLFEVKSLSLNESALTGEWRAVEKGTDPCDVGTPISERVGMAYMGTAVASGRGAGFVVAVGDNTEVGKIAGELEEDADARTPLQIDIARVSQIMLIVIVTFSALIFAFGIIDGQNFEEMLLTAIAIAVASIPEGLPAAVTVILAIGMQALLRRGGLVRNLLAAETLGSTTYILTDKTGTLTEGRMAVTDLAYLGCAPGTEGAKCDLTSDRAKALFDVALAASDAFLDEQANEHEAYVVRGEPMERAVLEAALDAGVTLEGDTLRAGRSDYLAFDSVNRFAAGATTWDGSAILAVNGAPEYILDAATHVLGISGVKTLSSGDKHYFKERIRTDTTDGKRVMAVAYKEHTADVVPEDRDSVLQDLTLVGLIVFSDPLRSGINERIAGVRGAGVEVRLVTGDGPGTALAIARAAGIAGEGDTAFTGKDVAGLTDEELVAALKTTKVFARILPRQKMRIAEILKQKGEIVAMTGDGINDAPALIRADIGVAIGSGTEVAKEASDLVLVNDSFETIYAAIEEGRRIVSNLRKIVTYLLSTSLHEAVLIGGALVTGGVLPILPAQILWANIIEEGLMSIAFAFEPGGKDAMKERPRDIHEEGILSRDTLLFLSMVVSILSSFILMLYAYLRVTHVPIEEMRSLLFVAVSVDSLFIAFSFRSLKTPLWRLAFATNRFFLGSFAASVFMLLIVFAVPFVGYILSYEALSVFDFFLVVLYGLASLAAIETGKWLFFEKKR